MSLIHCWAACLASLESRRACSILERLLLLKKLLVHADKLIDLRLDHVLVAATDWLRRGHLGWHDELGRLHLLALERLLEVCLVVWVRVVACIWKR